MADQKQTRRIFVIMPFSEAGPRDAPDLTAFFQTNLKGRIEAETAFRFRYVVERSADQFAINEHIITSLYEADLVLCDLSGGPANPNVMFELGVRLAVSDKPVIMFRADDPANRPIFDISGYYIHPYSPLRYRELENFLIKKITAYEEGTGTFRSPVLATLRHAPTIEFQLRKGSAFQRLRMLMDGVGSLLGRFSGDIFAFLRRNDAADEFPTSAQALFKSLGEQREQLSHLPWDTFTVQPVRAPAVDAFLVDPFLAGFLPPETEGEFTTYVQLFHESWLNFGQPYCVSCMDVAVIKLRELLVFKDLIPPLLGVILYDEPENEQYLKLFYSYFNQSALKADVDRLKGVAVFHPPGGDEDVLIVEQSLGGDSGKAADGLTGAPQG